MKKFLLFVLAFICLQEINAQTTYYWVGSAPSAANNNISTNANWNTAQNGTGVARVSSTGASDILIFDGANLGGSTLVTGPVTVNANTSITCAQMKFTTNVTINMIRSTSGTSTITISGDVGDDWVIDAGSNFNVPVSTSGSMRFAMAAANSGKVGGTMNINTTQQFRIDNTTAGTGTIIFTSGSSLTSNVISSTSSSYVFGSSTQSSERWVVFQSGADLYYDGAYSPMGSGNLYSAIEMKPGSTWHQRATNPATGFGNFFNRKSYANIIVENNANLVADGPIYRIENLTINNGSSFITHTSGQTVVLGNLIVNGNLTSDISSTNELLLAGNTSQTISGTGTISVAGLVIADNANVTLSKDLAVDKAVNIYGKLDFNTFKLTGNASFKGTGITAFASGTANLTAGSFMIKGNAGIATTARGLTITGTGIAPNTSIVSFSQTADSIFLSNPVVTSGTAVSLSTASGGATLQTANTGGFDPLTGSIPLTGAQTFNDGINYIINAATMTPFGVTTSSAATPINAKFIEINAPVSVNRSFTVSDHLKVNGKITLRPLDVIHVLSGAFLNGTFSASNYIATVSNPVTGDLSLLQYDGVSSSTTLPVGSAGNYLPVILTPSAVSNFTVSAFEGITTTGSPNGTPFTPSEKQNVVNAVWNINRLSGSGSSDIQLGWTAALEGSTFATLPNSDIGIITNNGTSWSLPIGTANNTTNTASATINSFGSFGVGAIPQVSPFLFNALPPKTYGNPDFNGGATSLNNTQPIIYSSDNTAVATIVAGNIHITGAGTATITASQATDGFYPAASVSQTLVVSPTPLVVKADDKTKFQGQANPQFTITYTGFVLNETAAALTTAPVITTTAVTASPADSYPISVTGATSNNYIISFINGSLTVLPQQNQTITFAAPTLKTYGNADFPTGASSTNSTIPITYVSSNSSVATIIGNNIHIVGAGTSTITASQAGNAGYFAATDVARTLTVNKAALAVKVRDTTKVQGQPNPPFTITYTGFVLNENPANLLTPVLATTTATDISSAGYYPITLSGASSNNYTITYTNARLTIFPRNGTASQDLNAYMPNSNTLTVRIYSPNPGLGDIVLYDINGRPLLRKNIFMPVGFISTDILVTTLSNGLYIVTVRGNGVDLKKTIRIIH